MVSSDATQNAVIAVCSALALTPRTEADDELVAALATSPELSPDLGTPGATFIGRAEIAGATEYRQVFCHPSWPSHTSGITIGVGYDLQFVSSEQFLADWGTRLPPDDCSRLAAVCKLPGSDALVAELRDIEVPFLAAMAVFSGTSLPGAIQRTISIYPQIGALPLPRRTALVSLVYNRGTSLVDSDPVTQNRREMRAIRDLLAASDFDSVGDEFDSMSRLWPELPGLVQRRHDEATLWRSGFSALLLE